jgi:cytidylate kinase
MYRCVGLRSIEAPDVQPATLATASEIVFVAATTESAAVSGPRVLLDGREVTKAIRGPEIAAAASRVAAEMGVREALVASQRELIAAGDWVAEGRDIATVVAPDAELKVYLTADPAERARRRATELGGDRQTIMAEQALRDARDSGFGRSTLTPAPGAVEVDTTGLTIEQVVERIAAMALALGRGAQR